VNTVYVSMHADLYPDLRALFRPAEAAGNILAQPVRKTPVEDANARGFGTFTPQPASGQNVQGKGFWRDQHWHVLFVREIRSRDAGDVKLAVGRAVPVAFAVWDGENRDRNGRKVVSNWLKLVLER
jgi:DMSO reductase family type II enzyme heme b subunit